MKKQLAFLSVLVGLTGCAGPSPYVTPVESRTAEPVPPAPAGTLIPAETSSGVSVSPVYEVPSFSLDSAQRSPAQSTAPQNPSLPNIDQSSSAAVVALLGEARQAASSGDLAGAESQVERALRISPRDPQVYLQLAALKRQQGEYLQAEQVALRGVSVAAALPDYKRLLWLELVKIRTAAGDRAGVQEAQAEAARY